MADVEADNTEILLTLRKVIENCQEKKTKELLKILHQLDLKNGSNSLKSNFGYELLQLSLQKKKSNIAKLLLEQDVEVNRQIVKKTSMSPLHLAIKNDDLEIVKMLLSRGASTKCRTAGKTPLYLAVELDREDIAELLLEKDVDVNIDCDNSMIPVHAAAYTGNEYLFNLLLSKGGKPSLRSFKENFTSMLYVAVDNCYTETVEKLVKSSQVSEFIKDPGSEKLLTVAVMRWERSFSKIVQSLMQAKFPIDPKNAKKSEFICAALRKKYSLVVSELLKIGLDLDEYEEVLINACEYRNIEAVEATIDKVKNYEQKCFGGKKCSLLFCIIDNIHSIIEEANHKGVNQNKIDLFNRWFEIIKFLISKGVDVNGCNFLNLTPLHHIANQTPLNAALSLKPIVNFLIASKASTSKLNCSLEPIEYAITKENFDVVEALLQHTKNVKTSYLHYAARNESSVIMEMLLKLKANVNAVDDSGNTPLHTAAAFRKIKVMECLLRHNAKVNAKNFVDKTPLHLAVSEGSMAKLEEQCIEMLFKYKAIIDAKDKYLNTPLHCAAKKSYDPSTIKKLLEYKANIHVVNKFGLTPFLISASFNNYTIVNFFIKSGANVADRNQYGETALHLIAQRSNYPIEETIEENIDINLLTYENKTVIDYIMEAQRNSEFSSEFRENAQQIIKYMLKLHNIDVYICEENLQAIDKYIREFGRSNAQIMRESNLVEFKEKCEKEATLMKQSKIGNTNMTFYKLFKKSTHQLAKYLLNKSVIRDTKPSKYTYKFPIYSDLITKNLERGFERKKILDQDVDGSVKSIFYNLPGSCIHDIFIYLNNNDLQALVTASKIKKASINTSMVTRSRATKKLKT